MTVEEGFRPKHWESWPGPGVSSSRGSAVLQWPGANCSGLCTPSNYFAPHGYLIYLSGQSKRPMPKSKSIRRPGVLNTLGKCRTAVVRAVTQLSNPQFVSRSCTELLSLHAHWPGPDNIHTSHGLLLCSASLNPCEMRQNMDNLIRARQFMVLLISERGYKWDLGETATARRWGESGVLPLMSPAPVQWPGTAASGAQSGVKTWFFIWE